MAEAHDAEHHGPSLRAYFYVFGALAVFTAVSFLANIGVRHHVINNVTSFTIILVVAVCKALLVAVFFMHLLLDWKRVYILIIPALVLGPMLVIVLLPDIVMAWHYATATMVP